MNFTNIFFISTIFYICYYVYNIYSNNENKNSYLRKLNQYTHDDILIHEPKKLFEYELNNYNTYDYDDELIKVENKLANDLYIKMTTSDNTNNYNFNINCFRFFNNITCNEYFILKFNMTLEDQEINVINFMHYIFNNITINKNKTEICCNTYQLIW